jgi:hypothetical protein
MKTILYIISLIINIIFLLFRNFGEEMFLARNFISLTKTRMCHKFIVKKTSLMKKKKDSPLVLVRNYLHPSLELYEIWMISGSTVSCAIFSERDIYHIISICSDLDFKNRHEIFFIIFWSERNWRYNAINVANVACVDTRFSLLQFC